MTATDLAARRARYAEEITAPLRERGEHDPRVEAAFAAVERERYLTPPPWRILGTGSLTDAQTDDPAALYEDALVVLDRARGINNGQPSLHAAWLSAVSIRAGESVVQIGIGAGYYTAIIATLVGEGGRVDAYEIDERLAGIARRNLAGLPQVEVHAASGVGADLPETDVVYVSAAAGAPDLAWLRCLREAGRLVFPWQPDLYAGTAALLTRVGEGYRVRFLMDVSFIGCVGADPGAGGPPGAPSWPAIQSARSVWATAVRPPDRSATTVFRDVWFSSTPI